MGINNDALEMRTKGWRSVTALHALIVGELEEALQKSARLSVVEYTVLDALSRQDGWQMRMQHLARATALSPSATTRLVSRLENRELLSRFLCSDDKRGISTKLTEKGIHLVRVARPVHDKALEKAMAVADEMAELRPLVRHVSEMFRPIYLAEHLM